MLLGMFVTLQPAEQRRAAQQAGGCVISMGFQFRLAPEMTFKFPSVYSSDFDY